MTFDEVLEHAMDMLQRRGRLTYGALKRQFQLDDDYLTDLKEELIDGQRVAVDENGKVLVWIGGERSEETPLQSADAPAVERPPSVQPARTEQTAPAGERRQLTVMFCDLVGSTALSEQLDPEELQTVVRTYQEVSAQVIERSEGHVAQYLGDGLLVYFGYPVAHEDDAVRAVRTSLDIVEAVQGLTARVSHPVQVRVGIHTGLVVVGEMGSGEKREQLALGDTPNIAARIQGQAAPNEVLVSAATLRLITGWFETEDCGPQVLKGISTPFTLFRVVGESPAQSQFEVAVQTGLTPFIGREEELSLLRRRWERTLSGEGHVVLLSGEPGIGKSRLLQELKVSTADSAPVTVECRCPAYLRNSALAPVIGHVERVLCFAQTDSPERKLQKLEQTLTTYDFPLPDTVPLLTSLLSLPQAETYAPLPFSPEKQKEKTLELLVTWLRKDAERHRVLVVFEDLHWADPSSIEFLTLLVDQVATMRALLVLTFRPEFSPPWPLRGHMVSLTLDRLSQSQIATMAEQVVGKALPAEVVSQVVTKTDGVPLFVEELTKSMVESGQLKETESRYELIGSLLDLAIPTTLQDSLRARLDRLNTSKEVAQVGATIGREFSYELVQAVSSLEESVLQEGLRQLVDADLVFQKGLPPQAQYVFKHALIQDAAYQSLLKSRRQQLHAQTAQVLEQQFAEMATTQPELLAHHYTEAGVTERAIPYWYQAGQKAIQQWNNLEAISHLSKGLELLKALPATPELIQQELMLQIMLGVPFAMSKGWGAAEVGKAYSRAQELCQQVGETLQVFPVLYGLFIFNEVRAEHRKALALAEQCLYIAQNVQDPELLLEAYYQLGCVLTPLAEFQRAREYCAKGIALYDIEKHHALGYRYAIDPGVAYRNYDAHSLWYLGYPDQALKRAQDNLTFSQHLTHPYSQTWGLITPSFIHTNRCEGALAQEKAEAVIAMATERGLRQELMIGTSEQACALILQGKADEGIARLREALAAFQAMGTRLGSTRWLVFLAEAYRKTGQLQHGLTIITEAFTSIDETDERWYEAEAHRVKGELVLLQDRQDGNVSMAADCFQTAIDVARHQEGKSLELRAATSLARLWQSQGKTAEARELLAPVYEWFTEGFDTRDLQEAKTLLEELT